MSRSLRSNFNAPDIYPFNVVDPMVDAAAVAGGGAGGGAPPVEVWTENPLTGNFNPGTTSGQKIFLEKTKGLATDKRLALSNSNAQELMEFFKVKEQTMGSTVSFIPTSFVGGVPSEHKNLIHQSPSISLEACQRNAHARFATTLGPNDPIPAQPWTTVTLDPGTVPTDKAKFYDRVNGNVVVEIIKNTLLPCGFDDLMLQADKFTFIGTDGHKSFDGPTMLKVLLEEIDPTASVNIEMHRQAIEGAKLHDYKNNVVEMVKAIEKHHMAIVSNNHNYDGDTFRRHLLTSLLTGSNSVFNNKMQLVKSDVDGCYGFHANITSSELILMAKQLYTNIERRNEWTKVDPKDAQIMALLTSKQDATTPAKANDSKMSDDEFFNWRKTFKGQTVERQGKSWNWCPHHKKDGHYDGLYYSNHTADTHAAWKTRNKRGGPKTPGTAPASTPVTTPTKASLQISETLRNALCTNLCVSEEDLAKIIDAADGAEN